MRERERESSVCCLGPPRPQHRHPGWARRGARWCRGGLGSSGSWGEVLVTGPPVCSLSEIMCVCYSFCMCLYFVCACEHVCLFVHKHLHTVLALSSLFNQHTHTVHLNSDHWARLLTVSRLYGANGRCGGGRWWSDVQIECKGHHKEMGGWGGGGRRARGVKRIKAFVDAVTWKEEIRYQWQTAWGRVEESSGTESEKRQTWLPDCTRSD